jgi:hypothetical protein
MPQFEFLGRIRDVEIIAQGCGVYRGRYSERNYGKGRWRKMNRRATVQFVDGTISSVEVHGFEAHGIGRKDFKIKSLIQ